MTDSCVILSGGIFHPFEATSAEISRLLEGIGIRSAVETDIEAGIARLSRPGGPKLLVVNALRWRMHGEKYDEYRDEWAFSLSTAGREAVSDHVRQGGGLLGLHTASICFDDWEDWGEILGARWAWGASFHPPAGPVSVRVCERGHPITHDASDFELADDEVYSLLEFQNPPSLSPGSDLVPLLAASNGESEQTLAWARSSGGGRVVYDALGHGEDTLAHPAHRRFVARAALWCLGRGDAEVSAAFSMEAP